MLPRLSFKDVWVGLAIAAFTKTATGAYIRYKNGFMKLGSCPGRHHIWMHPFHTAAIAVASIFPPRGWMAHYAGKFSAYAKEGSTILSALVVWDATPMFWLADADAIRTVTADRHTFRKEVEVYDVLEIYGKNLVSTEGDEWRRHLAIAGPAFNEATYALAWAETVRVVHDCFEDLDLETDISSGKEIDVTAAMTRATVLVISAAGFGRRVPWSSFARAKKYGGDPAPAGSGIMPYHVALSLSIDKLFIKVLTPEFAYSLPFRIPWLSSQLKEAQEAFTSLKLHMEDLAANARDNDTGEADLLRRLVKANEATKISGGLGTKGTLTEDELFSNIFVSSRSNFLRPLWVTTLYPRYFSLLDMVISLIHNRQWTFLADEFAETCAHTLSFAIMLLALHPEAQQRVREEVLRVWPTFDDCLSSSNKKDFNKLNYTLAVFRETLRCFPSEPRINKIVEKDTILTGTRFQPSEVHCPPTSSYDGAASHVKISRDESKDTKFTAYIPKGSAVTLDIWALHMNPLYWGNDAHLFRPDRFIDTSSYNWPRDAFLPFSAGARGCIGKSFATTESVCLLACLVRRYEILPPDGIDVNNLTETDKGKMLAWRAGVTVTPTQGIVRLKRYPTG